MIHFPPWSVSVRALLPVLVVGGLGYVTAMFWYGASPLTIDVGYEPDQPVPFSHALHNGKMGIDCRYCHNHVEEAAHSNVPTTEVCMNCHSRVKLKSPKLQPVRDSWATGEPIQWVRVHQLPDFAYFNHSAHVNRNVGCQSCHGQVNEMEKIRQVSKLSMGWCLDCHRIGLPTALRKLFARGYVGIELEVNQAWALGHAGPWRRRREEIVRQLACALQKNF